MDLDVLLFGGLREALGRERVRVALAERASVRDLVERLEALFPSLRPRRGSFAVAVNLSVAREDEPLGAGDEVALLPPVGGG